MFIIDDLLFWLPVKGIAFIAQKTKDLAEKEERIKNSIRQTAMELERLRETGRLSQKEFEKKKRVLLDMLNNAKNNR